MRWLAPVRPGDTLHTEVEVIQLTPSRSKPDRGIAKLQYRAINQRQEAVAAFYVNHMVRTRGK
jgi:acyl dehydratase